MQSEARKKATAKYKKSHLRRIGLDVQKDYYENVLKPAADKAGEPVNTYIKKAIARRIEDDNKSI